MLLSIDRVLQLLAEGKSVQKIAEMSGHDIDDIYRIIDDARTTLVNYNKGKAKKKIIIKKKNVLENDSIRMAEIKSGEDKEISGIFEGAELSMIPLGSSLLIFTDGSSEGNPGHSGIGIVIFDKDNRQVGKVSYHLGIGTNNYAEYSAIIRALKIAIYFQTKILKIRTDSELVVKQIKGEYKVNSENLKPLYNEAKRLKKMINSCVIEHIPRSLNDKADYLAKRAVDQYKKA